MIRAYEDGYPLLLAYQQAWNRDRAQVKVAIKSRRIGLSWGDAAQSVLDAAGQEGSNTYYISYDKDMTAGYIADCQDWAAFYGQACGAVETDEIEEWLRDGRGELVFDKHGDRILHKITRHRLDFDSGHFIQALSSMPRTLRSKGRPGEEVVVDEAAFCDNLDAVIVAALAFTTWGGRVRIISTHNGDENAFARLEDDIRAGRVGYSLHVIDLDDAIGQGLARRIHSVRGIPWSDGSAAAWRAEQVGKYREREDADEELFCVRKRGAGRYLARELVERAMEPRPVLRRTGDEAFNARPEADRRKEVAEWIGAELDPLLDGLDKDRRHVFGWDFARSMHLSAIAPIAVGADLSYDAPFLVELRNMPHAQQEQIAIHLGRRLPRFSRAFIDASGNGSGSAEKVEDVFGPLCVEKVKPTTAWYVEHMPRYKGALQDSQITMPRDDDVLEDHGAVRLHRGVPKIGDAPSGKAVRHGDAAMAMLLAHAAATSDAPPKYAYRPVGAEDPRGDPHGLDREDRNERRGRSAGRRWQRIGGSRRVA